MMSEIIPNLRKRARSNNGIEAPWSKQLRDWRDRLHRGESEAVFRHIDTVLSRTETKPFHAAAALGLVGDAQANEGRFHIAASTYAKAASLADRHPRLRTRLRFGEIAALLRANDVNSAELAADALLDSTRKAAVAFKQLRQQNIADAAKGNLTSLPERPVGPGRLAVKLIKLFAREGEYADAQRILEKWGKKHGKRAQAWLAIARCELTLQSGDAKTAAQSAQEVFSILGLNAKTVSILPLWLRAVQGLNQPVDSATLESLLKTARPPIKARAVSLATRELRALGDPRWSQLASTWLAKESQVDPVLATDLRKQLLSNQLRTEPASASMRRNVRALQADLGLARQEWIALTRADLRTTAPEKRFAHVEVLLRDTQERFGPEPVPAVRHALALTFRDTGDSSAARQLFESNLHGSAVPSTMRTRALWALAELAARSGDDELAARLFGDYATTAGAPARFATLARVNRIRYLLAGQNHAAIRQAETDILAHARTITKPFAQLDMARALAGGTPPLRTEARRLYSTARDQLLAEFRENPAPLFRLQVLLHLARRETYEFHDPEAINVRWGRLSEAEQNQLWSSADGYWEFRALQLRALSHSVTFDRLEEDVLVLLKDPATPGAGVAWIGNMYAERLMVTGRTDQALAWWREIVRVAPHHPEAMHADYQLAIDAYARKDSRELAEALNRLSATLERRTADSVGTLIKATIPLLDSARVSAGTTDEITEAARRRINRDLRNLGHAITI